MKTYWKKLRALYSTKPLAAIAVVAMLVPYTVMAVSIVIAVALMFMVGLLATVVANLTSRLYYLRGLLKEHIKHCLSES
jgi:hypothetical protein